MMTRRSVRQVAEHKWPSGFPRAIAVLKWDPEELASQRSIRFVSGRDDLDELRNAYLVLPSGATVALRRHHRDPSAGTTVLADAACIPTVVVADLKSALEIAPEDILWQSDDAIGSTP